MTSERRRLSDQYFRILEYTPSKRVLDKLRNQEEDTLRELEVACYFKKKDFEVELDKKIGGHTPDCFITNPPTAIEVINLKPASKLEEKTEELRFIPYDDVQRIRERIEEEVPFQTEYPNVLVLVRPDFVRSDEFVDIWFSQTWEVPRSVSCAVLWEAGQGPLRYLELAEAMNPIECRLLEALGRRVARF